MSDAKWHFMLYFFEVNTSLWVNSADEVIHVLDGRPDGRLAYSIRPHAFRGNSRCRRKVMLTQINLRH